MAENIEEALAKLQGYTEGENPIPSEIVDSVKEHFLATSTALEGATVQISEKDAAIAARDAEISRLKSANYDLTVKASALPGKLPETDNKPRPQGIAGLFAPKGK